ncbi:MAG: F0F1 ATP synthase subunit B [Planctomycetota bacterium]
MNSKSKRFVTIFGVLYVVFIVAYVLSFTKLGWRTARLPKLNRETMVHSALVSKSRLPDNVLSIDDPKGFIPLAAAAETDFLSQVLPSNAKNRHMHGFYRLREPLYIDPAALASVPALKTHFDLSASGGLWSSTVLEMKAHRPFFDSNALVAGRQFFRLERGAGLNTDVLVALLFAGTATPDAPAPAAQIKLEVADCIAASAFAGRSLHLLEDIDWLAPGEERQQNLIKASKEKVVEADDVVRLMLAYDSVAQSSSADIQRAFEGKGIHDINKLTVRVTGAGSIVGLNLTKVFVALNFLLLVGILYGLLWEPVTKLLDERAAQIQTDLSTAKTSRVEAETLKKKYETLIEDAHDERNKIIDEGRREGQKERAAIISAARTEAEGIRSRSREEIFDEARIARKEIQKDVAAMVTAISERILSRGLMDSDTQRAVDEFVSEVGALSKDSTTNTSTGGSDKK